MSDEMLMMVQECIKEHSKNIMTPNECNARWWGTLKWLIPICIGLFGGIFGMLITINVDIGTTKTTLSEHERRITQNDASFKAIDSKLDIIISGSKNGNSNSH